MSAAAGTRIHSAFKISASLSYLFSALYLELAFRPTEFDGYMRIGREREVALKKNKMEQKQRERSFTCGGERRERGSAPHEPKDGPSFKNLEEQQVNKREYIKKNKNVTNN
ncbi:MAG: oxysterol-binding protein [Deltaproteobacteria bacterium]|nr:oxysterol-binding protein [Deltaproteobacteria bacterium]